jgi:hypothetical protein
MIGHSPIANWDRYTMPPAAPAPTFFRRLVTYLREVVFLHD